MDQRHELQNEMNGSRIVNEEGRRDVNRFIMVIKNGSWKFLNG